MLDALYGNKQINLNQFSFLMFWSEGPGYEFETRFVYRPLLVEISVL